MVAGSWGGFRYISGPVAGRFRPYRKVAEVFMEGRMVNPASMLNSPYFDSVAPHSPTYLNPIIRLLDV